MSNLLTPKQFWYTVLTPNIGIINQDRARKKDKNFFVLDEKINENINKSDDEKINDNNKITIKKYFQFYDERW